MFLGIGSLDSLIFPYLLPGLVKAAGGEPKIDVGVSLQPNCSSRIEQMKSRGRLNAVTTQRDKGINVFWKEIMD